MDIKEPAHAQLPLFEDRSPEQKIDYLHLLIEDLYSIYFHDARRRILAILDQYNSVDEAELKNISQIRDLVERVPNIFCQNCEKGHITGSALIVDLKAEAFLVHYHKKLGKWLQFGGHCGFGNSGFELNPADVALREAEEETGILGLAHFKDCISDGLNTAIQIDRSQERARNSILPPVDIDIHAVSSVRGAPDHLHLDFRYLLVVPGTDSVIQPGVGESTQFAWVEFRNVESYRDRLDGSLLRLIGKAELLIKGDR